MTNHAKAVSKLIATLIVSIALVSVLLAGYFVVFSNSGSIQNTTLMLDFTPAGSHAPFYYGLDHGIYRNNGINLTILSGQGSVSTIDALAEGKVNFGLADSGTLAYLTAVSNITNVRVVAMVYPNTTFAVIYNKAIITQPSDLDGKSITTIQGGGSIQIFKVFTQLNNVDENSVNFVYASAALYNQMVALGQADASLGSVGQFALLQSTAAKNNIQIGMFPYSDYGLHIYGVALMTTQLMIDQHPREVKQFVLATMQSLLASVQHPNDAVASLVKYNPQLTASGQLADFQAFVKYTLPANVNQTSNALTLGWIDPVKMNNTMTVMADGYGISNPPLATTLYTDEFVQSS